jgi:hypothetical protein
MSCFPAPIRSLTTRNWRGKTDEASDFFACGANS